MNRLANLGGLTPIGSPIGTVKAAGRDWELWDGYNGAMRVYSFVAPSQLNSFDGEIMDFFYVVKDMRGFPADSQHLLSMSYHSNQPSKSGMLLTILFLQLFNSVPSPFLAAAPSSL